MHANKSITYTDANALPTLLFQLLNGSYYLGKKQFSFTRAIWHSKQHCCCWMVTGVLICRMDRVQMLYGQCFRGWM
uniref:Uncharacterized protein n=1 Tax=Zea mays TaxID=4577 RepID=C0HID8_MAIZE|nr:unknown [Zea mays]